MLQVFRLYQLALVQIAKHAHVALQYDGIVQQGEKLLTLLPERHQPQVFRFRVAHEPQIAEQLVSQVRVLGKHVALCKKKGRPVFGELQ